MIREAEKTDTIKLYVHLISKLKRAEEISLGNKLLSTEVKNITNRQIKLMLEVESLHYDPCKPQEMQEIVNRLGGLAKESKTGSLEAKNFELLRLKAHSAALSRALQEGKDDEITQHSAVLLQGITSIEQLRFVLQAMFRIRSLASLLTTPTERLRQRHSGQKELRRVLYVLALVRASESKEEGGRILKSINTNPGIIDEKKRLIEFLGALIKKQKELLDNRAQDETLERSMLNLDKSTKKVIKNSIETECKIFINEQNPSETFNRINTNLEEQIYLHAFPLTQLYFERNPDVIEAVRHTELYKYLITSKSFLVENMLNNSYNSVQSRSKSKKRPKKNPNAHDDYLKADQSAAHNCVALCRKGMLFTKHNYGNLKSSTKFVRVGENCLEYFKNSEAEDSGTRWSFEEILCVVYGKATPRQQENEEDYPENCFSVVLKDRTFDLSVVSSDGLPDMLRFIRGLSYLLGQFRQGEKTRVEEELRGMKDAKRNKILELNERIAFHEGKVQQLTMGGLLWSKLLLSLNSRAVVPQDGRATKMEGMRRAASKASSESQRRG